MRTGALIAIIVVAVVVVIAAAGVGVVYAFARDVGPVVDEQRNVGSFTRIDVDGAGTVIIHKGDSCRLSVNAGRDFLDRLETTVTDGTLHIRARHSWLVFAFLGNDAITYDITMPQLEGIDTSGAIVVQGDGVFEAQRLVVKSSGSSKVDLHVDTAGLHLETSGSTRIALRGHAGDVSIASSGSTKIEARGLSSRTATIDCSGSSDIQVNVSEHLTVDGSGSTQVSYHGAPTVSQNLSGSGTVRRLE